MLSSRRDKYGISAADASGVALVAIQALLRRVQEQDEAIAILRRELANLRTEPIAIGEI